MEAGEQNLLVEEHTNLVFRVSRVEYNSILELPVVTAEFGWRQLNLVRFSTLLSLSFLMASMYFFGTFIHVILHLTLFK